MIKPGTLNLMPVKVYGLSPAQTGGPIVKTGPTAGQNRSRNKNGRWRAKRSDAGVPRSK